MNTYPGRRSDLLAVGGYARVRRRGGRTLLLAGCFAAAAVILYSPSSNAEEASLPGQEFIQAPSVKGLPAPASYTLDSRDHLQIRFYDRFDREDLNAEYIVNESGSLRLPRIGSFQVRGKTTAELEQEIRQGIEKNGEKPGYFTIEISECRPFYVTGLANHPGAYAYVPGFTVMHAVSLAGGLYRSPMASVTDALRERRELTITLEHLGAQIARRARLLAERENATSIPVPKELVQLVQSRARDMIENELTVLRRNLEVENRDRTWFQDIISLSKKEANDYSLELSRIKTRISEQEEINDQLRRLHDQKIINQQRVFESVVALDSIQRDKEIATTGLSQANHTLQKAERDLSMLALAKAARISQELAETEQTIAQSKLVAAQTHPSDLEALATQGNAAVVASYRIMRRNSSGQLTFVAATEETSIMPGDVIQIDRIQNDVKSLF